MSIAGILEESERPPGRRSRRVLLVDDDASLRMMYRFNLEASGVEVMEAGDGEAALEHYTELKTVTVKLG